MFGGFNSGKLKPRKFGVSSQTKLVSVRVCEARPHLSSFLSPTELKMAVSRIQIASNKKAALLKQNMREVAVMLAEEPPKEEKAKIRAEALIRDDMMIEAYEILQLECELLHERIKLIEYSKCCPPDLCSVVATLMWASHRVDIPELVAIRKQFRAKYGKTFEEDAMRNNHGILNERVITKLSVEPPAAYLVQTYLERICEQFEVDWKPTVRLTATQMVEPMAAPVGYSVPAAQGTGLGPVAEPYGGETAEDEAALKRNGGVPPPVVTATAVTPMDAGASATSSITGAGATNAAATTADDDDFAEPDIFVPGPPTAPPGSGGKPAHNDDDDDPPIAPGDGGSSNLSASYSDLAARFDSLKR